MGYASQWQNGLDTTLATRVAMAGLKYALNTLASEPDTTINHANRATYAQKFVDDPQIQGQKMCMGLVAFYGVESIPSVTDAQIDTGVAAVWNVYAGLS